MFTKLELTNKQNHLDVNRKRKSSGLSPNILLLTPGKKPTASTISISSPLQTLINSSIINLGESPVIRSSSSPSLDKDDANDEIDELNHFFDSDSDADDDDDNVHHDDDDDNYDDDDDDIEKILSPKTIKKFKAFFDQVTVAEFKEMKKFIILNNKKGTNLNKKK